jgi:hypothetical protein
MFRALNLLGGNDASYAGELQRQADLAIALTALEDSDSDEHWASPPDSPTSGCVSDSGSNSEMGQPEPMTDTELSGWAGGPPVDVVHHPVPPPLSLAPNTLHGGL